MSAGLYDRHETPEYPCRARQICIALCNERKEHTLCAYHTSGPAFAVVLVVGLDDEVSVNNNGD